MQRGLGLLFFILWRWSLCTIILFRKEDSLRIFKLYLPIDLFNRIKLMSKFYRVSISKMMTELLEIGYLEMLKTNTKGE